MRERDVADTSSWEPWQHDYRFGVVLVMPPPHVAAPIDALRQAYDQKSHAICSAHISVSDPLRRHLSDDARKEIQELLRTVEPFEVHYDRPTASAPRIVPGATPDMPHRAAELKPLACRNALQRARRYATILESLVARRRSVVYAVDLRPRCARSR